MRQVEERAQALNNLELEQMLGLTSNNVVFDLHGISYRADERQGPKTKQSVHERRGAQISEAGG